MGNRFFVIWLGYGLLFASGCATLKTKRVAVEPEPPTTQGLVLNSEVSSDNDLDSVDLFLNKLATEHPEPSTVWWADYRRAELWTKKDPKIACENYASLAQVPAFPLHHLALLRAYLVCPKNDPDLAHLSSLNSIKFPSWLQGLKLNAEIRNAILRRSDNELVYLYLKKSREWLPREEKIRYSELALRAARWMHCSWAKRRALINEIQTRIYSLSPSRNPHPSPSQFLEVADDFRYRRDFYWAHRYYLAILRGRDFTVDDKIAAFQGLRLMYKIELNQHHSLAISRDMARYIERIYRNSEKTPANIALYMNTLIEVTEDEWTQNHDHRALDLLWILQRSLKGRASLAEVDWLHGRIDEERRNFKWAIDWYHRALKEQIATRDFKNRILWNLAWDERTIGQYGKAIPILKTLAYNSKDAFEKAKYKFWLAKTLEQTAKNRLDNTKEARADFTSLIKDDQFGYYGLLAARELNKHLSAGLLRNPADVSVGESDDPVPTKKYLTSRLKKDMDPVYLDWLISVNETHIAGKYLNHVAFRLQHEAPNDTATWVALLRAYSLSKNYSLMFSKLADLGSQMRDYIIANHPKMLYPMPYSETVDDSATRFGVEPELIYAIMRQESTFNPRARSPMDAFGLMQILPQVAARTAKANAIPYHSADQLYDPQVNIPTAAAYLRKLWDRYDGDVVLTIASYNARSSAINSWLKTRYDGNTLDFIEDIPYDETRDYVKLVLRNLITYQLLDNSANTMHFPESTLKISYRPARLSSY